MYCSSCSEYNFQENMYCLKCGVNLFKSPTVLSIKSKEAQFCNECGNQLDNKYSYCPFCGINLMAIENKAVISFDNKIGTSQVASFNDLSLLRLFQNQALLIRSVYGAIGSLILGLILAWLVGLAINTVLIRIVDGEIAFLANSVLKNPLLILFSAHGASIYVETGVEAMGAEATIGYAIRAGTLLFLFIPFISLFTLAFYNSRDLDKDDINNRFQLALWQGIIYGVILAICAWFTSMFISIPIFDLFDPIFSIVGMGVVLKSGFSFFITLFMGVLWGCLFSMAGVLYPTLKFNYSKLSKYFQEHISNGIFAAFKILKANLIISIVLGVIGSIFFIIYPTGLSIPISFLLIILATMNVIPSIMLILQGAVFNLNPLYSENISLLNMGIDINWLLFLTLLVPISLGVTGGFISQKRSLKLFGLTIPPWKNALSFSSIYTFLYVFLILVSQISIKLSGNLSMIIPDGEWENIILGFPMISSLLIIFVFSFISSLLGVYLVKDKN